MKSYSHSPLPFQGQKRRFLKAFKESLKQLPKDSIIVDLFGGSGLLSHTAKDLLPNAQVIYNDYDGFTERISHVAQTNILLADIRAITAGCVPDKKLPDSYKQQILRRIGKEEGFVDYITLSGSLLFSGKYATNFDDLKKHPFYCKHKQKDYVVDGYLEGVQVVSCDYRSLYEQYKDNEKVVFLLDPPYLSTDSSSYKSDTYWKLRDYLDVITLLNSQRYVYFTSNKSQIIELCEWIASATNGYWANPFAGAETRTVSGSVNYNSTYTDIMVYNTYSDE